MTSALDPQSSTSRLETSHRLKAVSSRGGKAASITATQLRTNASSRWRSTQIPVVEATAEPAASVVWVPVRLKDNHLQLTSAYLLSVGVGAPEQRRGEARVDLENG